MAGTEAKEPEKVAAIVEEGKHKENGNETESAKMAWLPQRTRLLYISLPAVVRCHSNGR